MRPVLPALRYLLALVLSLLTVGAHAQLAIEITGAGANRFPVIIPVFENEGQLPNSVTHVVRADLQRSGLFRLIDLGALALPEAVTPDLPALRHRGADAVLSGSIISLGNGRYEARFRLFDTQTQLELGAMALPMVAAQHRLIGHRIADFVYEQLTGQPGYFATRIAYVVKSGANFELQIADADGMNAATALRSREPIISPAWAPDGERLAYVSFEQKKPIVDVHTLATGQRRVVANFKGSNSAPSWSPDGNRLAVVLTKDGLSQLYVLNADGSDVRRLASSAGIDTEPFWDTTVISTSPPIAAAVRRSIASLPRAAARNESPLKATTTSVRACRPTASCWPSSPATLDAFKWQCRILPRVRSPSSPIRRRTNRPASPPMAA